MEESIQELQPNTLNPLLARVEMPGSTFQLPSRGLFYDNGELRDDVSMGEVHVKPMSAYDEILMKTVDQLYSGDAVEKVFKRCIPQILKPLELMGKDVDFLLVCLRQVTYGDEMEVSYTHNCENGEKQSYIIQLSYFIGATKKLDPTTVGKNYTVTLENDQVVKLRPSKFSDIIKMFQENDGEKNSTPEEELDMAVLVIKSVIQSVDGETNKAFIIEWIKTISAGWIDTISNAIQDASDFGTDVTLHTKCKDCGKMIDIKTPINPISFFM